MSSTIKIKHAYVPGSPNLFANEGPYVENGNLLHTLADGELAYNAYNNGLYIGYDGNNYLLSVANENGPSVQYELTGQRFYGTASKALKLGEKTVGSNSKPIYFLNGEPFECTASTLDINAKTATLATTATKLSKGYGSLSKPIYIKSNGTPAEATEFISTVSTLGTDVSNLKNSVNDNAAAIAEKLDITTFNSHKNNSTIHITANERTAWNAKAQAKLHIWGDDE